MGLFKRQSIVIADIYRAFICQGFPSGPAVKNMPVMQGIQEIRAQSLGGEDPLEEEMTACSSILAGKIPWTEEPGRLATIRRVTKS